MKRTKMLAILVLALGLMVCFAQVGQAAPMGTAFTYQGRLMDKNKPADGLYDFQFKLYDSNDPCTGTQLASPIDINDLETIDGHFIVELDFGSGIFDGNAVWLETRVVESPLGSKPSTLSPLVELTPTPYALYAQTAGGDNDWKVSGNDMYAIPRGNIGIGTSNPQYPLTVDKNSNQVYMVMSEDGTDSVDHLKFQLAPGHGTPSTRIGYLLGHFGDGFRFGNSANGPVYFVMGGANNAKMTIATNGNVGIGTTNPTSQLSVIKQGTDARATVDIQGQGTGGGATLTLGSSDLVYYKFRLKFDAATGDSVFENNLGTGDYRFRTWNGALFDERFTILNNGNVGIGTTGPTQKLDVAGNVTASRYYDRNNTGYYVDPAGTSYCNDMRANIFYDRGNTTYYVDPANTGTSAKFAGAIQANGNIESFGDNGNLNARFSYLTGYPNNGYIAVKDAAGTTQAGMYVDSSGNGRIYADSKSFRVANPGQPGTEIWYTCPEGPEAAAYVRGTGHLTNGKAEIILPDHFVAVASPQGITVQVTPLSAESRGLAVVHKAPDRFVVQELAGGNGTYDFDYLVMAVRKGHEGYQVIRPALEAQAADAGEAAG